METTNPKRRKRYRVLMGNTEYKLSAARYREALDAKLLVQLSDGLAETAEGVSITFETGVFCLRRSVTPSEWVLTNWLLIERRCPAPSEGK